VRTTNRILVSTLAIAGLGLAQFASATNCPGPDAAGKSCTAPADCDTAPLGTLLLATSYRALAGGTCADDGAIQATGFYSGTWYGAGGNVQCYATNGYIINGACVAFGEFINDCPLPDATTPTNFVGIWDDWNCSANAAANWFLDLYTGGAKFRGVNLPHFNNAANTSVNLNLTLYATGDRADARYISCSGTGCAATVTATVGTEITGAAAGLNISPCSVQPAVGCTRFIGFTPPPDLQDVLDAIAALEVKADDAAAALAALEVKADDAAAALAAIEAKIDAGGDTAALEAKLDAIQLILTPPSAGCTLFHCPKH
jgi:hypothetical protein